MSIPSLYGSLHMSHCTPRLESRGWGHTRVEAGGYVPTPLKPLFSRQQDRPIYKGSQSTLGGRWGPGPDVEVDELGRPVLWSDSRDGLRRTEADGEKEERRRRVESYLKNSNMSLVCVSYVPR